MQQRPDRVVGIDAPDPFDRRLRDGLPVGHDREGLERRRRQPHGVGPDVARDERAALGRGRELDAVAVDRAAGCRATAATPRGRRGGRRRSPGPSRQAPRSRAATAAARRRTAAPRGRPRSARSAAARLLGGIVVIGPAVHRGCVLSVRASSSRHANDSSDSSSGPSAGVRRDARGAPFLGGRRAGHDRAPRLGLLDDDLAPLHQLEHGQERDRDDDAIADAAQQVLEDHGRRVAQAPRG